MNRHEKVLLALATVLLLAAWGLCSDTTSPQGSWTAGEVPWDQLLWQYRQALAPVFALVGLASAISILFLRAVHWQPRPALADETGAPEKD